MSNRGMSLCRVDEHKSDPTLTFTNKACGKEEGKLGECTMGLILSKKLNSLHFEYVRRVENTFVDRGDRDPYSLSRDE